MGIADRSCFDLTKHAEAAKVDMSAKKFYEKPVPVKALKWVRNRGLLGKTFKKDQKIINEHMDELDAESAEMLMKKIKDEGKATIKTCQGEFEITNEMIKGLKIKTKMCREKSFLPGVIEPSFGVGRILYAVLEHSYFSRPQSDEDKKKGIQKGVMSFPVTVAPVKCAVFALTNRDDKMRKKCAALSRELTKLSVSNRLDLSSTTIGRRYVRSDEIGLPFVVTVDFETVEKSKCSSEDRFDTVTLRERDTAKQIRVKFNEVAGLIYDLTKGRTNWSDCLAKYPNQ